MLGAGFSEDPASLFPTGLLCPKFSLSEIKSATQDFDQSLLIGQGGFGKVYKGTMKIGTKTVVAIKRLDSTSAQGAAEFWAEIEMLSMLRHCNLVSLIGYCNDSKEMILVYEYMPNGTLEDHLHKLHTPLSLSQRLKICIGAARALHYLHSGTGTNQGIIHRDVKSSNILLDNKWAAKISDFGLSKVSPIGVPLSYVSTLIKGTFGYFDPEYFSTGRLTRKSDVFSFGVILLEVLCRKRAVDRSLDDENWGLVGWAQDFLRGGKLKKIIDPDLKGQVSLKCLNDYAKLVDGCLQTRPKLRITMAQVVYGLESILALHERSENSIATTGITTFGKKLQKYFFSSEDNSGNDNYSLDKPNLQGSNLPDNLLGELVAAGWPSWLAAVSGEALKGWSPLRADTFKNLGKIGEGSYSVVYKARDTLTEDIVALKKLQCDPSDPESVKMISMEIAILRRLDHPNVIKLKGIVTSRMSETLYLVFEYMDHDLATLSAKADMHFTEHQVKHYMNQLLSGLKYCHDHQVLHRDIKGSDLLLDNNGVLKIADFGCASFFDLIHEQPMTNRVATFWYRAPELLLGATEYGVGVDLWSAGCILAGLLAKGPILAGHTEGEQIQKIYALCGSPSDEYWKTYKLPLENIYKPELQSRRRIRETFNDFSPSSLSLLDILLSIDPVKRQTAASALRSKFLSDVCQPNKSESSKKEGMGSMISNTSLAGPRKQDDYVHGSVVWDHFTELVDHGGKKICRCNYCSEDYDYASTFGSSVLMNHIKNCVSNPYGQRQSKSKLSFPVTKVGNIRETKISLYSWRFDQQVASKSIVKMIIRDKLPFKFVENEGFRRCMELCQPALVIPSLSAIRHDCYGLLVDEKEKLKSILKESTLRVCLTTDTWTSVQRVNYMCLTAHFIDINWKLQKKVIDFFPISNLKGSDIGRAIELCLVNWDLRNVFTVTANSASSNDTVVEYLTRHFVKRGNLCVLNGKWTHVRCINHIISLVVHDAMKEIGGSVDRIRAAVKYVTESPPTMKKFQEFAKLEKLNCEKPLCLDIPTHWSSTYFMLRIAIIYEKAFDRFAIADFLYRSDLQEGPGVPCSFDWDNVRRLVGFLQHYYQLSIRVSGTKYITSNIFLDYICCIHNVFKECSSSEDAEIRKMSSVMKRKFDRYWGEIGKFNLLVYIASVFDPRTKYMYLEVTLCKMYGDEDGTKIATLCKNTLYELFNDYQRIHYGDHLKNVFSSSNVMNHSSTSPRQSMGLFGRSNDAVTASREKNLAKLERKKEELGVTNDPKSELDIYLTQEIEGDDYYFRSKEFSVLDWWKKRSETFPILSLVARDVLAIPVSTMAESSFSTRGRVLNSFRTTFNPKTIQALICCQDWIRPSDAPVNVEQHIQGLHKFEEGMRETFQD